MLSETLEGCGLSTDPSTDCHHHIAGSVCDQINIDKSVRNSKNQMPIRTYSTIPNNLLVTSKIPIRVHTTTLNYQRKSVLAPVLYTSTFLGQECKIVANHKD